ncbi:styrene monooxygenase/indole monooxygenase family protein [Lipingzhangella sp. LS1_29]|uniref:Styrene monooxygenase/indole monooxygenase family protein n=1 Tax=Lipingzhangella rawalii TaxID=2055835 RepID=A0ABU2HB61_9ACTN|nr:styrene monooxygenase/indole monooxygenase family protein [Lipingzhangella rawalii]MDS1272094.1 styrene monooxygenase/indole monooxygenase family protein [Lipingzhangella rawalii]
MRRILIVGGGQAGLQLALGLQHHDYDVTLMTARTSDELRTGRAVSFQAQWFQTLAMERNYGLNLWDDEAPDIDGLRVRFAGFGGLPTFDFFGRSPQPAQSLDERLKVPEWQDLFEQRGGTVIISPVTSSDLDQLARMFDLVVIAAGHSGLAEMFPPNPRRSLPEVTPTTTVAAYVQGDTYPETNQGTVDLLPNHGFLTTLPSLTRNGPGRVFYITSPSDGVLASWPARLRPAEHLDLMLQTMREFAPHLHEHFREVELVDHRSVAVDHVVPRVREPVAQLPSGGLVMGIGDTVLSTLPQLCQDPNNASQSAEITLRHILARGDEPFDSAFMHAAFEEFWDYAHHMAGPVAQVIVERRPFLMELFYAASEHAQIGDRFVRGLGDPADYAGWFTTAEDARAYIAGVADRAAVRT